MYSKSQRMKPSQIPKASRRSDETNFWSYIEPFFELITKEDLQELEQWKEFSQNNEKYLQVSHLGEHFVSQWSLEDMTKEALESTKCKLNKAGIPDVVNPDECHRVLKEAQEICEEKTSSQDPPLINNLVSALVKDNLLTLVENSMAFGTSEFREQEAAADIEENIADRLTNEFEKIGLLQGKASKRPHGNEVADEIQRLQSILEPLSERNAQVKEALLEKGRSEMVRQELKRRLRDNDEKLMESFRRIKNMPNKTVDVATLSMLTNREKIIEKLEELPSKYESEL